MRLARWQPVLNSSGQGQVFCQKERLLGCSPFFDCALLFPILAPSLRCGSSAFAYIFPLNPFHLNGKGVIPITKRCEIIGATHAEQGYTATIIQSTLNVNGDGIGFKITLPDGRTVTIVRTSWHFLSQTSPQ